MSQKIEASYRNLERVITWIQNADNKSSIVLAFNTAMIAVFFERLPYVLKMISLYRSDKHFLDIAVCLLLLAFLTCFIASIFNAVKVIFPDVHPRVTKKLFFFGSIAALSKDDFIKGMNDLTDEDILNTLSEQTYINSEIASNKFRHLKLAWKFLVGASSVTLLLGALTYLLSR